MRTFTKLAAAAAIMLAGTAVTAPALAQRAAKAASARLGGHPNLNGIWHAMNSANWNLEPHDSAEAPRASIDIGAWGAIPAGLGVVEGGVIPYKPEALAKRDENRKSAPQGDPEAKCYLPGIPRATYVDHAFQIIQADAGDMLFAYEYASANRVIQMKKVEIPPIDTWMGTSYGAWEGDTLKVVTLSQNGETWLDRAGNFLSGPNATVTERFKLIDKDHMSYEVTIDDPDNFTRPWKISMPLYRNIEPNAQLLEFRCVPFAETMLYRDLLPEKDKYPKK